MHARHSLIALGLVALGGLAAWGQVAPQPDGWRGPQRNGVFEAKGFPTEWSDTKNLVWQAPLPDESAGEPIVVGERIYLIYGRDSLGCFDLHTGIKLWEKRVRRFEIMGKAKGYSPEEIDADDRLWNMRWLQRYLYTEGNSGYGRGNHDKSENHWDKVTADLYDILRTAETHPKFRYTTCKLSPEEFAKLECDPTAGGARVKYVESMAGEITRYLRNKYTQTPDIPTWYGWGTDNTGATPCTDGQRIYIAFGEGHVACTDLDGNLVWGTVMEHKMGRQGVDFYPSPLLAKGVLVVWQGVHFTAYDAQTGRQLWDREKPPIGYRVGSPLYFDVEGKKDVVVTTLGHIVDLHTGEDVGSLNMKLPGYEGSGTTPPHDGQGTFVYWDSENRSVKGTYAMRLKLTADGKVEPEKLWEAPGVNTGPSGCIWGGKLYLYAGKSDQFVSDMATGKGLGAVPSAASGRVLGGSDCPSFVVADGHLVISRFETPAGAAKRGYFGPYTLVNTVLKLGDKPTIVAQNRLTTPTLRRSIRDKFVAELGREVVWKQHGDSTGGCAALSNPHFTGNRLILRTMSTLYCVGDTATPFTPVPGEGVATYRVSLADCFAEGKPLNLVIAAKGTAVTYAGAIAPGWEGKAGTVDAKGLTVAGDALTGTLTVSTIDAEGKAGTRTVTLKATIKDNTIAGEYQGGAGTTIAGTVTGR